MRLLLTSGGVTVPSIRAELERLLGKPVGQSDALFVPTAQWGQPQCCPQSVWSSTAGRGDDDALVGLGWRSVGVLELTALPTIDRDRWAPWVQAADVLLVDGGEAVYLAERLRASGLLEVVAGLPDLVWVGVSAGSMALTPRIGREFVDRRPDGTDETLGLVDFSLFPHLEYPGWTGNTTAAAHDWATRIPGLAYAIDDRTAISVADGETRVVSEGHWERFER